MGKKASNLLKRDSYGRNMGENSPGKAYITVDTKSPLRHYTGDLLARNAIYHSKPATELPSTEAMVSGVISRELNNSSIGDSANDDTHKEMEVVLEYPSLSPA